MPAEAKVPTEAGAEAFVRYYFDILNYGYLAPADGILEPLSDQSCALCLSLQDAHRSMVSENKHVDEKAVALDSVTLMVEGSSARGELAYTQKLPAVYSAAGEEIEPAGQPSSHKLAVVLAYEDAGWLFTALG